MERLKEFLRQQIFPGFSALIANRKVDKILLEQQEYNTVMPEEVTDRARFRADIENLIKSQLERKSKLEDKAKSLLFIITLAITTATFSLNFLKDTSEKIVLPVLAIMSICYLVFAGVRIISAINIRAFYVKEQICVEKLEDDAQFKGRIIAVENEDNEYLRYLAHNKVLNDLICTKIANLTYASFILVRNGIILFACFFAVSIAVQFVTPKKLKEPTTESKNNLEQSKEAEKETNVIIKLSVHDSTRLIKNFQKQEK